MKNIKIKIESKLINYNLEFEHKVNIVRGNSATGKSLIVRLLDNKRSSNINIDSNYKLFHLNSEILEGGYKLNPETVYILDEDDGIEDKVVVENINKNKYKFILIIRDANLSSISYSIDQIYEIFRSGKYNLSRKVYSKDLNKDKLIEYNKIDSIVVEDSGSGYEYYRTYDKFEVLSSNGNSNINKNLKSNQIVVIDSIAFGPYIKTLKEKSKNKNIFTVYPKTFEWLVLTSKIFRISDESLEKDYINGEYNINKEKYYEAVLKEESNKININYSKSKLSEKFKEISQLNKINERLLELFNIDIQELNKNLENQVKWRWE